MQIFLKVQQTLTRSLYRTSSSFFQEFLEVNANLFRLTAKKLAFVPGQIYTIEYTEE